jgi:maleylacetate reductase
MRSFTRPALPGTVLFGQSALAQLPEQVALLGSTRPLLLVGATPEFTAHVEKLLLDRVGTWDDVRQHVPADLADRCPQHAVEVGADLLACAGGGSTTGLGPVAPAPTT